MHQRMSRDIPSQYESYGKVSPHGNTACGIIVPANTNVALVRAGHYENPTIFEKDADVSEPQR